MESIKNEINREGNNFFVINCYIVNSFILFDKTNQPHAKPKEVTLLNFQKKLSVQLVNVFSSRKKEVSIPNKIAMTHTLYQIKGKFRECVWCAMKNYKTDSGIPICSSWKCKECNVM